MYKNYFNFIEAKNNDGSCHLNKATYSSELVTKLIDVYFNENSLIYDPFMGTGTTAVGCVKNNKKVIGFELSEEQTKYALDRLQSLVVDSDDFSDLD